MAQMLAVLLIRSLKKSSLLFDSMESRCYDGEIRVLNEAYPADKIESAVVAGFLILMMGIAVFL